MDNHFQSKTFRREIILQSLRRSKRLNPTGINSQSIAGSQPDNDETQASVVSLQLNNLIEGKLISKDELLTEEDDTDYIEDFIDDNLLDDLYNINDNFLDSPSTTHQITYGIYMCADGASKTWYLNRTVGTTDGASYERLASWLTAQEVAA